MIDLIGSGINLGVQNDRELVVIPSALFVKKCEETLAGDIKHVAPL